MSNTPAKCLSTRLDAVNSRYMPLGDISLSDGNLIKLRAIVSIFGLGFSDVAKACLVSRPYVSRVLCGQLQPSPRFLRHLEGNLGKLIEARQAQVFQIAVTPTEEAVAVVASKTIPLDP